MISAVVLCEVLGSLLELPKPLDVCGGGGGTDFDIRRVGAAPFAGSTFTSILSS